LPYNASHQPTTKAERRGAFVGRLDVFVGLIFFQHHSATFEMPLNTKSTALRIKIGTSVSVTFFPGKLRN
jgi:hypothetical protein